MSKKYSFIILLLFIIFFLIYKTSLPFIWIYYHENNKYPYINLCIKSIYKYCSKDFNIKVLNKNTVNNYLFNLRNNIDKLTLSEKVSYYKFNILYKYGGIWIEPDTIIFKNLNKIYKNLEFYDFIGSGCYLDFCKDLEYNYPSNEMIASRKGTKLIKNCILNCNYLLDNNNHKEYYKFEKDILLDNIRDMLNTKWNYFHVSSICSSKDNNYNNYTVNRLLSYENIDKKCKNDIIFLPLQSNKNKFPDWLRHRSENYILKDDLLISKFFKLSLKIN